MKARCCSKFTALIFALILFAALFALCTLNAFAADDDIASGECDGVPYRITADRTLIIGEDGGEFYFTDSEYRNYS